MRDGETKLADQPGKFAQLVRDGRTLPEVDWIPGRLLLSERRLVLAAEAGRRTVPLAAVNAIKSREDVQNPLAKVSSYISVQVGDGVMLLSPSDYATFERALYTAVLDGRTVAVKHPAVEGGVVRNTNWVTGQLSPELPEALALGTAEGRFVELGLDDIGGVERNEGDVLGERRPFVEVEHTAEERVVETHIAGPKQVVAILADLLATTGDEQTETALSEEERELVMALYSGVSPFQIPEFVGLDVDRVEEVYADLVDAGLLIEKRRRREVRLTARGRTLASEATDDE